MDISHITSIGELRRIAKINGYTEAGIEKLIEQWQNKPKEIETPQVEDTYDDE